MSLRKRMTKEQRADFPAPQWGDHVLRGVEGRTRASYRASAESVNRVMEQMQRNAALPVLESGALIAG